jgi:hypothetical protein
MRGVSPRVGGAMFTNPPVPKMPRQTARPATWRGRGHNSKIARGGRPIGSRASMRATRAVKSLTSRRASAGRSTAAPTSRTIAKTSWREPARVAGKKRTGILWRWNSGANRRWDTSASTRSGLRETRTSQRGASPPARGRASRPLSASATATRRSPAPRASTMSVWDGDQGHDAADLGAEEPGARHNPNKSRRIRNRSRTRGRAKKPQPGGTVLGCAKTFPRRRLSAEGWALRRRPDLSRRDNRGLHRCGAVPDFHGLPRRKAMMGGL